MCCLDVQNAPFEHFRKRCAVGVCTLSSRQGRVWGGFGNSNLAAIVNFLKIGAFSLYLASRFMFLLPAVGFLLVSFHSILAKILAHRRPSYVVITTKYCSPDALLTHAAFPSGADGRGLRRRRIAADSNPAKPHGR